MSGAEPDSLREWATARGLHWQEEDTLPPTTDRLRNGVGVGAHRASIRTVSDRGFVSLTGSNRKRPERQTVGVGRGQLPGGLEGKIGHHVYLIDQGAGQEDRYIAITDTVVYAELPWRSRPVFNLNGFAAQEGRVKAAVTIGGPGELGSPLDGVVPPTRGSEDAGGIRWTSFPAEPDERVRRIASAATRFLDGLPADRVEVEYVCGVLAVWVKDRVVVEENALDQLCRFASALASGLGEVADSSPPLVPDSPLDLPEPDAREEWVREGAALVTWEKPPVSVVAAQERYRKDVKPHARKAGWKLYGIVAAALVIFSLLVAAGSLILTLVFDDYPMPVAIMIAVISVAVGVLAANRIGLQVGQEAMDGRIDSSAVPWGLEAFADGYARHSGLTREDPEELRRRLEVPFDGRAQLAWQGELAPGAPGHLSCWIDATNTPDPPRFFLLAVTAATGAATPVGCQTLEQDGLRLTWQEVTSVHRADHRLDQLRGVAAG